MQRRLHLIPFTVTIQQERRDKSLAEKLLIEKDLILQWAIAGCVEWQARGLEPPTCVLSATQDYFESEDSLGRWMNEMCVMSPHLCAGSAELFGAWKEWAERAEEYVGSMRRFSESLRERGYEKWRDSVLGRMGFKGIALKSRDDRS